MEKCRHNDKGISTKVNFEIIDPKEGSSSFSTLVGRPWGIKMKASISLDKERIKLKGNGKKVIVPIHPSQGEPRIEPIDEDYTEPNIYGELHLGNQDSVGYNSDTELYDWEFKNYKTKARGCWTVQIVQNKSVQ